MAIRKIQRYSFISEDLELEIVYCIYDKRSHSIKIVINKQSKNFTDFIISKKSNEVEIGGIQIKIRSINNTEIGNWDNKLVVIYLKGLLDFNSTTTQSTRDIKYPTILKCINLPIYLLNFLTFLMKKFINLKRKEKIKCVE